MLFQRTVEPREGAFTVSMPKGWIAEGGIMRADHFTQIVSTQTIEAKVDFALKSDPAGRVMIRWCPEMKYCDSRMMTMGMMFPPGSNYGGMMVYPFMSASQFIATMLFPWAHPRAVQPQMADQRPLPELAGKYQARVIPALRAGASHDAAEVTIVYNEDGTAYREIAVTAVECLGPLTAGMWSNKETHYFRAPADEFDSWRPVFDVIRGSVRINPHWAAQEQQSQQMLSGAYRQAQAAQQQRNQQMLETQRYIQRVGQEIVEHRQRVNAEIRNDAYLFLSNQEEYVNPYTNEIDTGSNQWRNRWVTSSGDEFYTDDDQFDPNTDGGILNRSDWQQTKVRQRYPDKQE